LENFVSSAPPLTLVRAGAGAGKTRRLTNAVLHFVQEHVRKHNELPRLIVTTFTRKATEELRERISGLVLSAEDPVLHPLVESHRYLQISTLHGVFGQFLRRYGRLVGLDPDFKIVDESQTRTQAQIILRHLLGQPEVAKDQRLQGLLSQWRFSDLLDACLLRREWSVWDDVRPATETESKTKAKERLDQTQIRLQSVAQKIRSETSHPKWQEYLVSFEGRRPNYKDDLFSLELFEELKLALEDWQKTKDKVVVDDDFHSQIGRHSAVVEALAKELTARLNDRKMKTGQFDSTDLELFTVEVLRKEPALAGAFASDCDGWFVDEYQDTSPLQAKLLDRLTAGRPVFFVGDPQQSIYLFRGARSEVFSDREKKVRDGDGQLETLDINFRSTPRLLQDINLCLTGLGPEFLPMKPRPSNVDRSTGGVFAIEDEEDPVNGDYTALTQWVRDRIAQGEAPNDFCVLARTNQVLKKVGLAFEAAGIPCLLHSAEGFFNRREVLDLISLYKFLWNPSDNQNLVALLRSPWFLVNDQRLAEALQKNTGRLWWTLQKEDSDSAVIKKLEMLSQEVAKQGLGVVFRTAVKNCGIVEDCGFQDPTGRREANIWKFLTWLNNEERTPGFAPAKVLRKIERSQRGFDDDADAVAAKEPYRVHLMTVHKSKGLSFKHVILPSLEKPPRFSSARAFESPLILNEDNRTYSAMTLWQQKRTHSALALEALQELEDRERSENWRLLYVAMTRAEQTLILQSKKGAKLSPHSWAARLPWTQVRSIEGRADPSARSSSTHADASVMVQRSMKPPKRPFLDLASEMSQDVDVAASTRRRFSVTSVVQALQTTPSNTDVSTGSTHEKSILSSLSATTFGTELHRALENLRYQISDGNLVQFRGTDSDRVRLQTALDYTLDLDVLPMRKLLTTGFVEWGFQLQTPDGVLEGQVDLWGVVDEQVWIVDYKSGDSRFSEQAFRQLELYAPAVLRAAKTNGASTPLSKTHLAEIHLAVIFPLAKTVRTKVWRP
jgi:ATP-dependent helicase/nuclease subunit A